MPPLEQKHPNERKHLWDYQNPRLEPKPAPAPEAAHWPRLVYRANPDDLGPDFPGCDALEVLDQGALDAALADGWELDPIVPKD
jgi:hypothetical protein